MATRTWRSVLFSWRALALLIALAATGAGGFFGGVYVHKYRARIRGFLFAVQRDPVTQTNLYTLRIDKLRVPGLGRDGGIAPLADGLLFANRRGVMWFVDRDKSLNPLPLTIPINMAEFESDPFNATTTYQDRFAVKDLEVQPLGSRVRLLASYLYWHAETDCNTLRVSTLETTTEALLRGDLVGSSPWRLVFETTPCYPLVVSPGGHGHHITLGAGGRVALLSDSAILVSVGGFGPEFALDSTEAYWDKGNSYGKTVRVDVSSGVSRIHTVGHRNPQGLAVGSDGRIWLTDQAARGGDELNLLREGANYGYPVVSYGTEYERMFWPSNPRQGRHEDYARPMHAWVPSLGISQVLVIEKDVAFPYWKGDLLVSSLAAQTIYRVRIEEDRVIFVEPIAIGHRVRTLTEIADGTVVLKTDDDFLVYVSAIDAGAAERGALNATQRGEVLAATCRSCHSFTEGEADGIGPNLWRVYGRRVASRDGYAYSDALRALGGRWTEDILRSFLADPSALAPGTSMQITTRYNAEQVSDLITYLKTVR